MLRFRLIGRVLARGLAPPFEGVLRLEPADCANDNLTSQLVSGLPLVVYLSGFTHRRSSPEPVAGNHRPVKLHGVLVSQGPETGASRNDCLPVLDS